MNNLPAGVLYFPGERGRTPIVHACESCDREFEYNRDNGKYYFVDDNAPLGPITAENTQHGWFCCADCQEEFYEKKAPAIEMVEQGYGLRGDGAA